MPESDYCFDIVRTADKDRFLSSLFAPDDRRPHLHALYAFNIELARIRETVSEPAPGEIKLRWWTDAVRDIRAGTVAGHPVAQALARTIADHALPYETFLAMIEARRFDLYDDAMPSLNDLEGYLGETSSALIQLAFMILAPREAAAHATLSGLAGVAMGLTGILRSLPLLRARGQCFVPREILHARGLTPAQFLAGSEGLALQSVLADLSAIAAKRYTEARTACRDIPTALIPALLPASLVPLYLERLRRLGSRSLFEVADVPQWRRQWHLFRKSRGAPL